MYRDDACGIPAGRCADQNFRLAVYEAGHALSARALGLKLVSVRMLPRPPVLVSDKTFAHNNWESFLKTLEIRMIELFGGQIAEELACGSNTCCSGDIARIDELSRLVAGLRGDVDAETVLFDLEDAAQALFAEPGLRKAVVPLAEFFHRRMMDGREMIEGADIDAELDRYLPAQVQRRTWVNRLFGRARS